MPAAYNHALRDTYDPSKMFWASAQVMALNQGFHCTLNPLVAEVVTKAEAKSLRLVESSLNLPAKKFAEVLNSNAVELVDDWKNLYTRLLLKYDAGAGVKYDARHMPNPETPMVECFATWKFRPARANIPPPRLVCTPSCCKRFTISDESSFSLPIPSKV